MAKFTIHKILKSNKGQSLVEYILLLAVVASVSLAVFKSKSFKGFINGNSGIFAVLKQGMNYSYRYGRDLRTAENYDAAMSFEYNSPNHDTYVNQRDNESRFFMGLEAYGDN